MQERPLEFETRCEARAEMQAQGLEILSTLLCRHWEIELPNRSYQKMRTTEGKQLRTLCESIFLDTGPS